MTTLSLRAGDGRGHPRDFPRLQKALGHAFEAFKVLTDLTLVGLWTENYPDSPERLSLKRGLLGEYDEDAEDETPEGWGAILRLKRLKSLVLHRPAFPVTAPPNHLLPDKLSQK